MRKVNFIIALLVTIITCYGVSAQNDKASNNMQFHYGSPEANSTGQNTSVDLFRGTLSVNVPLHNYRGREIDFPITLGYSADGVQVEELASSAGLGWNLNLGGRMTSIVNGMPDEQSIIGGSGYNCGFEYFQDPMVRDKYVMDVGGVHEIFIMDHHMARCFTNPLITVKPHLSNSPLASDEWEVHMPDGTVYYFGENNAYEMSATHSQAEGTCPATTRKSVNSWLLTKVVSANGLDTFRIEYAAFEMTESIPNNGEGIAGFGTPNAYHRTAQSSYNLTQQMPTKVFHNDMLILEATYKERDDLKLSTTSSFQGNALDAIFFYNYAPAQPIGGPYTVTPYKKIVFHHAYFGMQTASTNLDFTKKRLRLDGITMVGIDGTNEENGDHYDFRYLNPPTGSAFPDIASYAQDYSGLYNGKSLNPDLIPTPGGHERDFSLSHALTGTLDKITYPGKGYSIFEYEQNRHNGSYGLVHHPATIQPITHEIELGKIEYSENYCVTTPSQYIDVHEDMYEVNLANYGGDNILRTFSDVRTELLRLEEAATVYLSTAGNGIYLIQQIPDTCSGTDNGCPPEVTLNSCLTPTDMIYYTGGGATNSNDPSNFIAGGLTDDFYGYNGTPIEIPLLPAGSYQITLWQGDTPAHDAKMRIYKTSIENVLVDAYTETIDTPGSLTDGFRIRSISNYDGLSNDPATKAQYRYGDSDYCSLVSNTLSQNGYTHITSQGYTAGTNVLFYRNAYEFQSDTQGDTNGYIKYDFWDHGTGHDYVNCTFSEYYLGSGGPTGVMGFWNFHFDPNTITQGKVMQTTTFNNQGTIMSIVNEQYEDLPMELGDIYGTGFMQYAPFYYLAGTYKTEYVGSAEMNTTTLYIHDGLFPCQGTSTTYPDESTKYEYYIYEDVVANGEWAMRNAGNYDNENLFYSKNTYATVNGKSLVTELNVGKTELTAETKMKYEYDSDSNLVTKIAFTPGTLTPASYETTIYGYSNKLPIVQISGLRYSDIDATILNHIKTTSNLPVTTANTALLMGYFKDLREWLRINHTQARAVCSTYNPVLGVTSSTGMTEHTIYYEYDILGRPTMTKKQDIGSVTPTVYLVSEKRYHVADDSGTDHNWMKEITYKVPTTDPIETPTPLEAAVSMTYLDGVGRPIQKTAGSQSLDELSGTFSDISNLIAYDDFGRKPKNYLPYPTGTNDFRFDATDAETLAYAEYANDNPFSEVVYDGSPLNRIVKSSSPGNTTNWAMGSGHEVQYDYGGNESNVVRKLSYENGIVTDDGFYKENKLYRYTTTDEDGNVSEVYKNSTGLLVMQRKVLDAGTDTYLSTYYCYDDYDNLVFVAPPKAAGSSFTPDILNNLCYQYTYDNYNRIVEKKLPEKQSEFLIYDKLNRVVMSGPVYNPMGAPTVLNDNRGWLVTFYDELGRVAYTVWRKDDNIDSNRRSLLQNAYDISGVQNVKKNGGSTIDGILVKYTDATSGNDTLLTVNYYDDYDFPKDEIEIPHPNVYYNNTNKPIGLPTGSYVRVMISGNPVGETSLLQYDQWLRLVASNKKNYLGGVSFTETELDFGGVTLSSLVDHKRDDNNGVRIRAKNIFNYYDNGAIKTHQHETSQESNPPALTEMLSENSYTKLGRVASKKTGNGMQNISYSYNIRGWLTGINDVYDYTGNSKFAFKINYDAVDEQISDGVEPHYNGSISETLWKGGDNFTRRYGYIYDPVNRMTQGIYNKVGASIPTNSYNEYLEYDLNGNITHADRNGNLDDIGITNKIDELNYTYKDDSDLLLGVYDNTLSTEGFREKSTATATDTDYAYDLNGNLISDLNKGIEQISYNHLNQPVEIKFANSTIYYTYDAVGNKVEKKVEGTATETTDYLDGFQYLDNTLKFFPTSEGYVSCNQTTSGYVFKYVYHYTDHLGNIRLSYTMDGEDTKILEENHYYPYGFKHSNYNTSVKEWGKKETQPDEIVLKAPPVDPGGTIDQAYKYRFNGQEWQNESGLNIYDMDLRDYDPAIARWVNIDPVTHHSQSPFVAFDCNPVSIADPSGADGVIYGMAGQSASSNPYPRGRDSFLTGNPRSLDVGKQNGIYDGWGAGSSSSIFWGSERSLFEQSWEGHNGGFTIYDSKDILNIVSSFALANGITRTSYITLDHTASGGIGGGFYDYKTTWVSLNIRNITPNYSSGALEYISGGGLKAMGIIAKVAKESEVARKTVVIGEDMAKRVIPYAKEFGYKYFKPTGTVEANWMKNQAQWIYRQIEDPAVKIIDIGSKEIEATSIYYKKELEMLRKYLGYE